jgi:hypothetical protein
VAKSRTIESDNAVLPSSEIDQTARLKVLNHTPIAVEQDERWSRSQLNVVEPNPLDCDEASRWRVTTLGSLRKNVIHNG